MPARILTIALVLVAAACSTGDDDAEPPTTSAGSAAPTSSVEPPASSATTVAPSTTTVTPSTTTTTTTTPATTEGAATLSETERADRELARTALITIDDFPDGWVEDPAEADEETDAEFEADFDACLGRDEDDQVGDRLDRLAVSTGDFHPAETDATQVSHEVVLAPDADTAVERMAEVDIAGAEECVADVITRFYQALARDEPDLDGIEIGDVLVTRIEREREADEAVGVLVEIPLVVDDQSVSQFLEFLYQREGRALSELSFSSFGQPFSRDGYELLAGEVSTGLRSIGG